MLNSRWVNFTVGAVLAFVFSWPLYDWGRFLEPSPYRNVILQEAVVNNHVVNLHFLFEKTGCDKNKIEVVGELLGVPRILTWNDLDGLPRDDSRLEGYHSLNIQVRHELADFISIKTRHDCWEEVNEVGDTTPVYVDKLFYRIDMREYYEENKP